MTGRYLVSTGILTMAIGLAAPQTVLEEGNRDDWFASPFILRLSQIGAGLAWTGLPQLVLILLVPQLMKRFDSRLIVAVGFGLFAASNFMNIDLSGDVAGNQLFWPSVVRADGQAPLPALLSAIATAAYRAGKCRVPSALVNVLRNLGGAVGISVLRTFLTRREQFHSNALTGSVSLFAENTRARIDELTRYFLAHGGADPAAGWH